MTLYALKDPKGRIDPGSVGNRAYAREALYVAGFDNSDAITRADCGSAARRLGWRIVKVRVVEVDT